MFDYTKTEIIAGAFVLLGLAMVGYLSVSIGGVTFLPKDRYRVFGQFSNVGDLKAGAPVKVAGVTVGKVGSIGLSDYFGQAELAIDRKVTLPKDTIASITTAGLLGDAYVSLSPGAADENLADGDRIKRTEPAMNVADLLGRYAFGTSNTSPSTSTNSEDSAPSKAPAPAAPTEARPR